MENTPHAKGLKFRLTGSDYLPGDDREYAVLYQGREIGTVGIDWLPSSVPGEPVRGFSYAGWDNRGGMGRTRAAAVLDAYADH